MVYMGSKRLYAKYIVPIIQDTMVKCNCTTFVDAMCGGCNLIEHINCDTRIAMDKNSQLIDLYNYAVYGKAEFPKQVTREMWDSCYKHQEDNPSWLIALVEFFTSYTAGGFSRGFCNNYPDIRDHYNERLRSFKKQIPKLKGINFKAQDILILDEQEFYDYFDIADDEMVCFYLDPPYKGTKAYGISKKFDHDAFWNKARELSKNNLVFVSEQSAPDDFISVWIKEVKRNVQCAAITKATENLFVHKSLYDKYFANK